MPTNFPRRGEIYFADLDPVVGHEQGGQRPVLIIQNDVNNQYSSVLIVAAITSAPARKRYPVDVVITLGDSNLIKGARVLLNQIKTIDKHRLEHYVGRLDDAQMAQVDEAIKISLGLAPLQRARRSK
jgi:mRNA interferase MazF